MSTAENIDPSGIKNDLSKLTDVFKSLLSPVGTLVSAFGEMTAGSNALNKNFTLSRSRIQEMNLAYAESSVQVLKLGGNLDNTLQTMVEIGSASKRNVIENKEVVGELYAASKILDTTAKQLVNNFKDVGYETSQIGTNLEGSITYIQSVGLNAREVMSDVSSNMEQMNRYQFQGGVLGLAKMAAHASMLRFDMNQTFTLAEKVLDPAGAIDVASAFQRLGVSAGNLIDPFQLMNQSINDPSGLQKSLEDVAKSFTYFDEQTQSFKINPQGVLTLRQIEDQTGVSAKEMSKMGLAAADLDRRLSQVSTAGLKFENEEDKQYLANIAAMGKGGKYEVKLEDGTKKELQNLNQEEFDKLIEQQKNSPKSLEEIQKSQLSLINNLASDAASMLQLLKYALPKQEKVRTNLEGVRSVIGSISSTSADKLQGKDEQITKLVGEGVDKLVNLVKDFDSNNFDLFTLGTKFLSIKNDLEKKAEKLPGNAMEVVKEILNESVKKVKGSSEIEKLFRKEITGSEYNASLKNVPKQTNVTQTSAVSKSTIMGYGTKLKNYTETSTPTNTGSPLIGQLGPINVPSPPSNYTLEQQKQWKEYFEGPEFARAITEIIDKQNKKLERTK
jgi:hypothetical protein